MQMPTKGQMLMNMTLERFESLTHVNRTIHILKCIGKPNDYVDGMKWEVTLSFLSKLRISYIDASITEYLARLEDDPEFRALQETSRDLADQVRRWHSAQSVTNISQGSENSKSNCIDNKEM